MTDRNVDPHLAAKAETPMSPWDLPDDIETLDEDDIDRLDDLDVHFGRHDWDADPTEW